MKHTLLPLVITALCATPAAADWQYTKWGMTPAQVAQASRGALQPCDAACDRRKTATETPRLVGSYKTGEFAFTAFAIFDRSERLSRVLLELHGPAGYALAAALRNKYGEPADKSRATVMDIHTWRDNKDQIQLVIIGDKADLTYRPRLTDSNKGL